MSATSPHTRASLLSLGDARASCLDGTSRKHVGSVACPHHAIGDQPIGDAATFATALHAAVLHVSEVYDFAWVRGVGKTARSTVRGYFEDAICRVAFVKQARHIKLVKLYSGYSQTTTCTSQATAHSGDCPHKPSGYFVRNPSIASAAERSLKFTVVRRACGVDAQIPVRGAWHAEPHHFLQGDALRARRSTHADGIGLWRSSWRQPLEATNGSLAPGMPSVVVASHSPLREPSARS